MQYVKDNADQATPALMEQQSANINTCCPAWPGLSLISLNKQDKHGPVWEGKRKIKSVVPLGKAFGLVKVLVVSFFAWPYNKSLKLTGLGLYPWPRRLSIKYQLVSLC